MTYHIITFGCQMNANDSEWLDRALRERGLKPAELGQAKIYILNTCSVREKPELKVYSLLGRLKAYWEQDPEVFVAVGGCVAQQIGKRFLERFPFVRLVFGGDGVSMAPQAIERLQENPGLRISLLDFSESYAERPSYAQQRPAGAVQAFVNIMQGCDNFCAYCIVPYVRGRQKSRTSTAILEECRQLADHGAREVTLLGQNVNSYGLDKGGDGVSFASLLRQVAAISGVERVRFVTSHPKDLSEEVIAAFGELPELCPQLHLPLQSGSDTILRAMGRRYDLKRYLSLVEALRRARPEITLSTDFIVGFPGETEADFAETIRVMKEVAFEASFSFQYCDRPGVRAERMDFKVPEEVKAERLARLQTLQAELTRRALARTVGTEVQVLLEGVSKKQNLPGRDAPGQISLRGRDAHGRVVNLCWPAPTDWQHCSEQGTAMPPVLAGLTGKIVPAGIVAAKKHSLFGKATGEPW